MSKLRNITALSSKNRYTICLDDDPTVHKLIEKITGIPSIEFSDTESFFKRFRQLRPLAFFVDVHIGMDAISGIEVVPRIRSAFPTVPILVITSDLDEQVLGRALEVGADDFIKKPLQGVELNARFRARLLSLRESSKHNLIRYSDISLDPINGRLSGNGKRVLLSPFESKILAILMKGQGNVVSKAHLKQAIWGRDTTTDNALTRKMFEVRKAVSEISKTLDLRSSYGKGFSLESLQSLPSGKKAA